MIGGPLSRELINGLHYVMLYIGDVLKQGVWDSCDEDSDRISISMLP